jgi:hypothetical protein
VFDRHLAFEPNIIRFYRCRRPRDEDALRTEHPLLKRLAPVLARWNVFIPEDIVPQGTQRASDHSNSGFVSVRVGKEDSRQCALLGGAVGSLRLSDVSIPNRLSPFWLGWMPTHRVMTNQSTSNPR